MEYIASISYGKDSLAMLEVIHRNGLPLDRIVTVEIWATKDIPADFPEMMEFKAKADRIILEKYGKVVRRIVVDPIEMSSSEVRACLKDGKSVNKMLPPSVEKYISDNHLYV